MIRPSRDPQRSSDADPQITALLRAQYAAPQDDAYWPKLEERIMASVRVPQRLTMAVQERLSWWSGFAELRGAEVRAAGLIAATLAMLAAGATFVRNQAADAHARELAARAAVEATLPLPIDDATLTRARIHLPPDAPERYLNPLDY